MPNHCKFVLHGVWHGGPRVSIRIGDELPIRVAGWVEDLRDVGCIAGCCLCREVRLLRISQLAFQSFSINSPVIGCARFKVDCVALPLTFTQAPLEPGTVMLIMSPPGAHSLSR